jgi:hypothetical protein
VLAGALLAFGGGPRVGVEAGFKSVDHCWDANSGDQVSADLDADIYALQGAIDPNSLWVTRLYGELSRSAPEHIGIGACHPTRSLHHSQ